MRRFLLGDGKRSFFTALACFQLWALLRIIARIVKQPTIPKLDPSEHLSNPDVTVIVPVLNEVRRLTPLLASLAAAQNDVAEILVVDGGSCDGTQALIEERAVADSRLRLVDAGLPPCGWNGKVWNMQQGLELARTPYVLFIDADVVVADYLAASLRATLCRERVAALSVATAQITDGAFSTALHAALLTTYIYRHGRPGRRANTQSEASANGQVFFAETEILLKTRAFERARLSRCDDLTVVHALTASGYATAFVETHGGASVAMYSSFAELATNWPRSLALCDGFNRFRAIFRMADIVAAQALPLPLLAFGPKSISLRAVNIALLMLRVGTLAGTARIYAKRKAGYWLSPLTDAPAVGLILVHALIRTPCWRGRPLAKKE